MDLNDTGNRVIAAVIVALLIIGAWYLGTRSASMGSGSTTTNTQSTSTNGTSSTSHNTGTTSSGGSVQVSGNAVSVSDQPAGSFVTIASATLPQTGWVAVRDAAGKTLGAKRLDAGTAEAVQVPLLRNTVTGEKYQVLLYTDDGDKTFDLHKDTLVTNSDGTVAGASFTALNGD